MLYTIVIINEYDPTPTVYEASTLTGVLSEPQKGETIYIYERDGRSVPIETRKYQGA